jgi:hypothetical protein
MTPRHIRWTLAACWIVAAVITFFAVDASSTRSWLYLSIVAFVPPAVLFGVWRDDHSQTIGEVMRGTESRS